MSNSYVQAYSGRSLIRPADVIPVPFAALDDKNPVLLVRYVGSSESGTVEVAVTTGDITFKKGELGAEAADTAVGLPTKNGIYDTSDGAANTLGEIVDDINASGTWQAVIVGGLRSSIADARLITKSATQAKTPEGVQLLQDDSQVTSGGKTVLVLLAPEAFKSDMRVYENGKNASGVVTIDPARPFLGNRTALLRLVTVGTGTGADRVVAYSDKIGSNDEVKLWDVVGPTTGVEAIKDFTNGELAGRKGDRVVAGHSYATTLTASAVNGQGVFYRSLN